MTINFKGKDRHVKCSQYALEVFTSRVDYIHGQATSAIYASIYALLCAGCYLNKEDVDFTFEEVCDWCDENMENKELIQACEMWAESFAYKKWIKKASDQLDTQKKSQLKSSGMKYTSSHSDG